MRSAAVALMLLILVPSLAMAECDRYRPGDSIQIQAMTNVYANPAVGFLGRQPLGARGTIVGGPVSKAYGLQRYCWYPVNYNSGQDGWSYDLYFRKTNSIPKIESISILDELSLSGVVSIDVTASDAEGIVVLYLAVDNGPFADTLEVSPAVARGEFTLTLDTAQYSDGAHVLTVYVYNQHGSMSYSWWAVFAN
jgi:hypothetical protein